MFRQDRKRIGFACKFNSQLDVADPKLNIKATTLAYLNRQTQSNAESKLWELVKHNLKTLKLQVANAGPMFRISSDVLPLYSHEKWSYFYQLPDVDRFISSELSTIGDLARSLDVRLSFHPAQFCVLASENPEVVDNSVFEFEYHCDIIRWMGFGKEFQDFKCNVHIGGKLGPLGIKQAMRKLSTEAKNCLTIENAEFSWGLEASLELVDTCALVLDVHHHWIATGEYINPNDPRISRIKDSWRGVRPVIHYSQSREEHIENVVDSLPDLSSLQAQGFTKAKLRAHSEMYWNSAQNLWAIQHLDWADIMLESKQKNLAKAKLIQDLNLTGY